MYQLSTIGLCRELHGIIYYVNYSHVGLMLLSLKLLTFSAWFKNMLWPSLKVQLIIINVIKFLLCNSFSLFHCSLALLDCLILKQWYKLDFRWWGSSSGFNLSSVSVYFLFHIPLFWFFLLSASSLFPSHYFPTSLVSCCLEWIKTRQTS